MKKWSKILVVAALAVMISVPAFAWNSFDHVKIAPNNKGDLMIFPFYYASPDGYETKVTIVNTDPVRSVVAKFIVRSAVRSEELIDFIIYLTHNDVWTGTFQFGDQGIEIYSEDDSVLVSKDPVTFASEANPMEASFGVAPFGLECSSGDVTNFGYVTVVASWWTDLTLVPVPAGTGWNNGGNGEPASKEFLYWAYGGEDGMDNNYADQWGCYNTEDFANTNANSRIPDIDLTDELVECSNINVLTGYMQFNNAVSGMETASALPATILRDYGNRDYLNIANETIIGNLDEADNVIEEIGAALSKDGLAMPLINSGGDMAAHILTFPTKFHYAAFDCDAFIPGNLADRFDWFWEENAEDEAPVRGCVNYRRTHYNMQELTAVDPGGVFSGIGGPDGGPNRACEEVQLIPNTPSLSSDEFPMGWYRYEFKNRDETNDCETELFSNRELGYGVAGVDSYTGVPVIATVVKFENNKFALMYGAWDNGVVENGGVDADLGDIYPFYQYSDDTPEVNANNNPIP